jgi:hypothetical protein
LLGSVEEVFNFFNEFSFLPVDVYEEFSLRYLAYEFGEGSSGEWLNFCIVLYSFLNVKTGAGRTVVPDVEIDDGNADWSALLGSQIHMHSSLIDPELKRDKTDADKKTLKKHVAKSKELVPLSLLAGVLRRFMKPILVALHLVYEDFKLNQMLEGECIGDLAGLLTLLAAELGCEAYIEYYRRDGFVAVDCEALFDGLG